MIAYKILFIAFLKTVFVYFMIFINFYLCIHDCYICPVKNWVKRVIMLSKLKALKLSKQIRI